MLFNTTFFIVLTVVMVVIILVLLFFTPNKFISKLVIYKFSKINESIKFFNKDKQIIFQCGGEETRNDTPVNVYIHVNEDLFFYRLFHHGEIGLGESFVEKWWDSDNLSRFLFILVLNNKLDNIKSGKSYWNKNVSFEYDKTSVCFHYDESNEFFMLFLKDSFNAYTCGFWSNDDDTLENAQLRKINFIIQKMDVKPNSSILDIGCGWGKVAEYIAKKTNSHCTGVTISNQQELFIKDKCDPNFVSVINIDYRFLTGSYDCIFSIGMFEHVRHENMDTFFNTIKRVLKPNGRFVLHTIVNNFYPYQKSFCTKHVFPGGQVPRIDWIEQSCKNNGLSIIHSEIFGGQHYARTLRAWFNNLAENEDVVKSKFSESLFRKYQYYFNICEAAFLTNKMSLGHFIITNNNSVSLNNSFVYNTV